MSFVNNEKRCEFKMHRSCSILGRNTSNTRQKFWKEKKQDSKNFSLTKETQKNSDVKLSLLSEYKKEIKKNVQHFLFRIFEKTFEQKPS